MMSIYCAGVGNKKKRRYCLSEHTFLMDNKKTLTEVNVLYRSHLIFFKDSSHKSSKICDSSAPSGNSPSLIVQSNNQTSAVVPFNSFIDVLCVSTHLLLTTATSTSPLIG